MWAIFGSLLLIVLYIAFRFDFKFAIPVIVALAPRHPDHRRHLLDHRPGGDDVDGRGGAHHPRLLDLRHDHHLRPDTRERPADAAGVVRHDRERVAVGDDPPLAGDDRSSRCCRSISLFFFGGATLKDFAFAMIVGITVRRVLVDLHRDAAAHGAQGARARVRSTEWATCSSDDDADRVLRRAPQTGPAARRGRAAAEAAPAAAVDEPEDDDVDDVRRAATRATRARTAARAFRRTRSASGAGSGVARGRMDGADGVEPGPDPEPTSAPDRDPVLERLLALIGPRVDDARSLLDDATSRWRGDALRVSEGTRHRLRDLFQRARPRHARGLGRARAPRRAARAPAQAARGPRRRGRAARVARAATRVDTACYRGRHGGQSGSPVRSRFLHR